MVTQSVLCEVGTEVFEHKTAFFTAAPAKQGCSSDARLSKVPTDLRFEFENHVKVKVELSLSTT